MRAILVSVLMLLLSPCLSAQEDDAPPHTDNDQAILDQVREIEGQMEQVRERKFATPTAAGIYTRDQLRDFLIKQLDEEFPPEKRMGWEKSVKAFGMFPRDADLNEVLLGFLTAQIAGFYDPETKRLYCITTSLPFLSHMVMVHEIAHALQDQHFNLAEYYEEAKDHDDRAAARQAVVEGEAQYLTQLFQARFPMRLKGSDAASVGDLLKFGVQQSLMSVSAPPYLSAVMTFPYVQGELFVRRVKESGGWDAVDALFDHPPQSTEQIIHPEKFLDAGKIDEPTEVVLPDLSLTLGAGWSPIYENHLGEMQTELFIRLAGDPVRAIRASWGWDGDMYRLYENASDGETLLQWVAAFDSENDAREMVDALRKVLQREFHPSRVEGEVTVEMDDDRNRVDVWSGAGHHLALVLRRGNRVVYLLGLQAGMKGDVMADLSAG